MWGRIAGALQGSDVVVFGNTGEAGDALVSAGARAAGVHAVFVDLPNTEVVYDPAIDMLIAPSHATAANSAQSLRLQVDDAAPPVVVVNPGIDLQRFSLQQHRRTRRRRSTSRYEHH